jgi:hypothetical protein
MALWEWAWLQNKLTATTVKPRDRGDVLMTAASSPQGLLVIDIDGLRQDVFHQALVENRIPHLASLLGGEENNFGFHLDPVSPFPSITFCAQSTIFTGQNPAAHGIPGNQFYDRFGKNTGGVPRFYAFDVGDALAYDDAVFTFTGSIGLLGQTIDSSALTLYERAARQGLSSTVVYHMVSRGAANWIRPSLLDIARFTKGGGLIGMSSEQYDHEMMEKALAHLRSGARPDILTVYFMGLDHTSHQEGPQAQLGYLSRVVDAEVGRLISELRANSLLDGRLVAVVSDHGQIRVIPDDRHSLRLSFPFDREMGYLFDALGLDVHDKPREGPDTDAVVASNGGMAQVYLRRRSANWDAAPRFSADVLPVAQAFWAAHQTGQYSQDLLGALSLVLVRNVEMEGWYAQYQALAPSGEILSVEAYLREHPEIRVVEAAARLRSLAGPLSGDLILVSNYAEGFYFGGPTVGVHGGLHPEDSLAVASLGWVGASARQMEWLEEIARETGQARRTAENRSHASLADLLPLLARLLSLNE